MRTISDFCEVRIGQSAPQASSAFSETGTPFIRAGSLEGLLSGGSLDALEQISLESASNNRMKLFPSGSTLFPKSGMSAKIGRVYKLQRQAYVVSHLAAVIPNEDVDEDYLYRWWEYKNPASLISNDAYPSIKKTQIEAVPFAPPSLAEQKRIAGILDQADALRRQRQRALDHLGQLGQSIFYEMFGERIKNENSKTWPELNSLLSEKLRSGAYYPKDAYSELGTEMVHMSDAFYNQVVRGNLKRVTCSESDRKKYSLNENDLLIARRSLVFEGAAKPCMIPESEEPLIFESSFIRIRPNTSDVRAQYLFHYLNLEEAKERFVRPFVTRSTISGINQANLGAVRILLPSITDQDEFCRRVQGLNELSKTHEAEYIVFNNLFASLQQRAFRGEL